LDGTESWGNINNSDNLAKTGIFTFEVADSIANNHIVNFQLIISYDDTTNLVVNLPVTLQAPKLEIEGLVIDDAAGNNNGRLDPSETAIVRITVKNAGKASSPLALGTLLSNSSFLNIQAPITLGAISANNATISADFTVNVLPSIPQNHPVTFLFETTAAPYSAAKTFATLLANPIIEDFESGDFEAFEWQMQGNKPWLVTSDSPYAGTTCSRSGVIANNQKSVMTLNLNILEEGPVSFARKVSSEDAYDYLKFTVDGVLKEQWAGEKAWEVVSFPLTIGMHTLSWTYEKDEFATAGQDRAWVDDIFLPAYEVEVATSEPTKTSLQLSIAPNPTHQLLTVKYTLDQLQSVQIEIYDLNGRQVQTSLPLTTQLAGSYSYSIDLQNFNAGLYFVKLRTENGFSIAKVVKI
jgi:hypothetical protein